MSALQYHYVTAGASPKQGCTDIYQFGLNKLSSVGD